MLTGVVLERLPRWATEDAGRGQQPPRVTTAGRWLLLRRSCSSRSSICVYLSRQQLNFAEFPDVSDTPVLKWISGPELTKRDQRLHRLVRRQRRHLHASRSRTTSPTG